MTEDKNMEKPDVLSRTVKAARKIVVKIGSNTIANADGSINRDFMNKLADDTADLIKSGKQVVIVSSGAGIAGIATINKWKRKSDLHYKQALCAIGQVELMDSYRKAFAAHDIHVAQILLTNEDFSDTNRTLHIRNTLFTLVDEGVVPVINENDSVSVDEIKIGDNDNLAALTSNLWDADLLILLSDIDGVYDRNPKEFPDAALIETVTDSTEILGRIHAGATNGFGTGGIVTKIQAAIKVNAFGIPMVLTNGKVPGVLARLFGESTRATIFLPEDDDE